MRDDCGKPLFYLHVIFIANMFLFALKLTDNIMCNMHSSRVFPVAICQKNKTAYRANIFCKWKLFIQRSPMNIYLPKPSDEPPEYVSATQYPNILPVFNNILEVGFLINLSHERDRPNLANFSKFSEFLCLSVCVYVCVYVCVCL